MRLTLPGDTVWGSGVNGKTMSVGAAPDLDVRAVRGPLTRDVLSDAGVSVPEVYGDPALLWPRYWPREHYLRSLGLAAADRAMVVVPNHNDRQLFAGAASISPLGEPHAVIAQIARSSFVCGSSLHGIVLAEAFGIPARLIRSATEPPFKYADYYAGTGRSSYRAASSVEEACELGGEPAPDFDASSLIAAFPEDIYGD
ncbi:polysaccharide pyruvyl transferase family protein [Microbacterium sp. 2P01SA-2]|uniref:polysaccharide pyruvyl transferase family protein n=1 Tax=unclassified Microbacterium TaxID=2609290 RepID=UPI0039A250B4